MSGLNYVEYSPDYELVDSIVGADYSWNAIGVWRNTKTNQFFYATDSGSSCNSAWDSLEDKDLIALTEGNFAEFAVEAESFNGEYGVTETDIAGFLHDIQQKMGIFPGVTEVGRN